MTSPGYRPLYRQVRDLLVQKVTRQEWVPGDIIPSEPALGIELGVSQGTVRKALDSLAADGVVERRQGKGTFVTRQTPERTTFHFFRLSDPNGDRLLPELLSEQLDERTATENEASTLHLEPGAPVVEVERLRCASKRARLLERLVIPARRVPDIGLHLPLPNAVYVFYQATYGVTVMEARESIIATSADEAVAERLDVTPGSALLKVERIAIDLEGIPFELRTSLIAHGDAVYAVTLR